MKLSGHSYDNEVFESLLDGLNKDIELKKTAQTKTEPDFLGSNLFSSTTADSLNIVRSDELDFIASELVFAADKAKIDVNAEDLAKFAASCQREGLRGKKLERAAQKYCNNLDRELSYNGVTKLSGGDLIDQLASHRVIPAGYNPEHGQDNSRTGKFMGSIRNPNTIWDTDAMQRQAQIALGDEQIKQSKKAEKDYRLQMKTAQWQEHQDKLSTPDLLQKGIRNAGSSDVPEVAIPKAPTASMSMFSSDRDFENIPASTLGEEIVAQAEARANKRAESLDIPRDIQRPMKAKDGIDKLFEG